MQWYTAWNMRGLFFTHRRENLAVPYMAGDWYGLHVKQWVYRVDGPKLKIYRQILVSAPHQIQAISIRNETIHQSPPPPPQMEVNSCVSHNLFMLPTQWKQIYKALCYQPEGRGFDTRWGEWIFSIYLILPVTLGPVYSVSNINEYQKQKNNVSGE
jgi:hypothetical protein